MTAFDINEYPKKTKNNNIEHFTCAHLFLNYQLTSVPWPNMWNLCPVIFPVTNSLILSIKILIHNLKKVSLLRDQFGKSLWYTMVLILDVNSEIGTHVTSNLCYVICSRHLIRSRKSQIGIFFSVKAFFPLFVSEIFWVAIYYKYYKTPWALKFSSKGQSPIQFLIVIKQILKCTPTHR